MYILELTRGFPFHDNPMLGCFEFDQAKALSALGNKVVMLSLDLRSIRHRRKLGLSIFEKDGIKIFNFAFPVGRMPNCITAFISVLLARKIFKLIIKAEGTPDVMHAHFCFLQGYYGAKLRKKHNIPLVITEHSSELLNGFKQSRTKYFSFGYNNANAIISVGTRLQRNINKRFGKEAVVIPNIVSLGQFSYKKKAESDCFTYIAVGSTLHGKGYDILLKAFSQLKLNAPKTHLIIIGDGPQRKDLEKLSVNLGLEDSAEFRGMLPREEIAKLLQQSQAFILTSRYETFGVVYIEALATGTPIIATKCGGPEDIVTEKNGLLVEIDDVTGTALAMKQMMNTWNKYNCEQIAKDTIQKYSPQTIGKKIQEVLLSKSF